MAILFDHHIILERFRGHRAFRDIDKKTFDIDSPANRIYLPGDREVAAKLDASPHPSRHVSSYVKAVCKTLERIADISSPSDRAAEMRTLIDAMRIGFVNSDLYTNVPIGKTREDVDLGIEKIFRDYKAYRDQYPEILRAIRDLEQKGAASGQDHLIKWLLYLDNPVRQKLLDEVIARNPGVNITAGNQDLEGTPWHSKFAALDPSSSIFRIPGSTPANPSDFPSLPGYNSPSLAGLNETERLTRIDPRFTGVLPAFPALSPNEQRLGQLPPTTAMPPEPQVLQFHSETGQPLMRLSDGSQVLGPPAPADRGSALLMGAAVLSAGAMMIPGAQGLGAALLAGATVTAATRPAFSANNPSESQVADGSVFSKGAAPYDSFDGDYSPLRFGKDWGGSLRIPSRPPRIESKTLDREAAHSTTFADRFGNWANTPAGTIPAQDAAEAPAAPAAGTVAPEEVRRLTRVNASNAGSVFASGSAPVPYLPSTEFNDRFGNWTMPTGVDRPPQTSRPIGVFADEPSYLIPHPIFGVDDPGNPHNDAEEWFSRWIRPLLRPE